MFRSGRPQIGCPTPHPTPHPLLLPPLEERTCVSKSGPTFGERESGPAVPQRDHLRAFSFMCSSWRVGPWRHAVVVSISLVQLQVEFLDRQERLFHLGPLAVPIWLSLSELFFCCKNLSTSFFPSTSVFFFFFGKERHRPPSFSRVVTWLFRHMRSTMQCVWHWMNEWMIKRWANVFMGTCTSRGQRWWTAKPYCVIFLCLTNSCQSV